MAQNINMQYVFMQNAGVLAPRQTDQLPPSLLQGVITIHRTNPGGRAISDHKLNMGFTQVQAQKKIYTEWRNRAKDQMIARGLAPAGRTAKDFPDADFLPICTAMRTLRPACDLIVSAVAANDMHRLEDIEDAVMELVKDSCRKLNDTNNKGKMVVPNPAIPPRPVVVHASLLPPVAPNEWGAATARGNPGQLPPNPPPAHVPAGGQLGQAPPGAAGPNVPAAQVNVPAAGQLGQAPPGAAGPNVAAARHLGQAPPGAAGPNVAAARQLGQAPAGVACPNVPAAQVNVPAAGQLGQAPPGAAGPNVPAAGQLGQAPPGAAGPNVPAAQVNVPAAGQLGQAPPAAAGPNVAAAGQLGHAPWCAAGPNVTAAQVNIPAAGQLGHAPPGDVPAAGQDVPLQPGNDPALPQMVRDSSSPDHDCAPAQMLPDPPHNRPTAVQNQPVARGFYRHPTVGPQVSHFLNHQPVSGFYLLTYEIQIGALYLDVRALCVSFMSCSHDLVWHYPSLKGIR